MKKSQRPTESQDGIPKHTNCHNCGACCGPIMATADELVKIKEFIAKMPKVYRERLKNQVHSDPLTCQFRDEKNHICAIYQVRPTICRIYGVVDAGGKMVCPYGNSNNLDPMQFLDRKNPPFPVPLLL